jgi:XisH protein
MSAKDKYHEAVKSALLKEQWKITDPLILKYEDTDEIRIDLETLEPERTLYLAVPLTAYEVFFQRPLAKASVRAYQVRLVVYNPIEEVIVLWNA